jgi:hypothetical protein
MKTSIEIIDDITVELMQLNRSQAVATAVDHSYFQGMIDALTTKRADLMLDVRKHSKKMAIILDTLTEEDFK